MTYCLALQALFAFGLAMEFRIQEDWVRIGLGSTESNDNSSVLPRHLQVLGYDMSRQVCPFSLPSCVFSNKTERQTNPYLRILQVKHVILDRHSVATKIS